MILFSIIIPTYERTNELRKCLECIENSKQLGINSTPIYSKYEIIVTDDGRNDDTKLLISRDFNDVKWIRGPKKGPAANRNNGANAAKGNWLIFTDDDCLPSPQWLNAFHQAIVKNPNVKSFEGAIEPFGNINAEFAHCPINLNGGCFWSANIAIEKDLYQRINGFDENYQMAANEDQDIYLRILKITDVKFVKQAVVVHPVVIHSMLEVLRWLPGRNKSWAYHCSKHYESLNIRSFLTPIIRSIKNQVKYLYIYYNKRNFKEVITIIIGFPINLACLSYYLYKYKLAKNFKF